MGSREEVGGEIRTARFISHICVAKEEEEERERYHPLRPVGESPHSWKADG